MGLYEEIPMPGVGGGSGTGGGTGTVSTIGTFSTASQVNGASISASSVIFGPSDSVNPGMVSTSAQTIAGPKTFTSIGTFTVPTLVLGTNANVGVTDSSSCFLARTSGVDNTGMGGGNVFNRLTSGILNTAFGWGNMTNIVTGQNNTTIGVGCLPSLTGGNNNIAIGYIALNALTTGLENISLGTNSGSNLTTGASNVFVGSNASQGVNSVSTGANNVALGANTLQTGGIGNYNICLGAGANVISTTASNTLVIGSSSAGGGVTQGYLGSGITSSAPKDFTLNATGGSGSNIAGANLNLAGGVGTGSAAGGAISFQTAVATSSGSTLNPLATAMQIDTRQNVAVGIGAIATTAINGFLYIPTCSGLPVGSPTVKTGLVPLVFESTSARVYAFTGGAWRGVNLT